MRGDPAEVGGDEVLVEQALHHRAQQRRIRSGPRRDVGVRQLRRAGACRVDDGQAPAPAAQRGQFPGEVGGGGHTAVGDHRVRSDDHEMIGAVEVRDGKSPRMTDEVTGGRLLRHLVEGAGAEHVAGTECPDEQGRVHRAGDGVRGRIAEVEADRLAAGGRDHLAQPVDRSGERCVPIGFDEPTIAPDERTVETIGIVVELGETRTLRTQVAGTEHVVGVTARGGDDLAAGRAVPADGEGQTAGGLAERADARCGSGHVLRLGARHT